MTRRQKAERAAKDRVERAAMALWSSWDKPTSDDLSYDGNFWRLQKEEQDLANSCARLACLRKRKGKPR